VRSVDGAIAVVDVSEPDGPGVRVRVRSAGICGSDLEMANHGLLGAATIGHEFAGVLDDGTEVAVLPFVPCGTCADCRAGEPQRCREVVATMYGVARDGGMADIARVDESCLAPLPPGVRVEDASLVEPLAVALHACRRGGVGAGMRVGVIGAGTIGLLCGAVARHLGADVFVAARHDAQRAAAETLGLAHAATRGCDVVVDAAGTASAFDDAARHCARGGTIVLAATTWSPITVSFFTAQLREQAIVPAFTYGHTHGEREFDAAARIFAAHPEIPQALVTHRFGLDEAARAFAVAADRAHGAIKVVLHP
jgi:threonine dehydrogenase-like Zn-dependent dehydrogenase